MGCRLKIRHTDGSQRWTTSSVFENSVGAGGTTAEGVAVVAGGGAGADVATCGSAGAETGLGEVGGRPSLTSRSAFMNVLNALKTTTAMIVGQVTFCFQTLGRFTSPSSGPEGRVVPPADATGAAGRAAAAGALETGAMGADVRGRLGVGFVIGAAVFGVDDAFVAAGTAEVAGGCTGTGAAEGNANCKPLGVWTAIN